MAMLNQELIDYIKESRKDGLSDDEITNNLKDAGWEIDDINEGFRVIKETAEPYKPK